MIKNELKSRILITLPPKVKRKLTGDVISSTEYILELQLVFVCF